MEEDDDGTATIVVVSFVPSSDAISRRSGHWSDVPPFDIEDMDDNEDDIDDIEDDAVADAGTRDRVTDTANAGKADETTGAVAVVVVASK